MLPSELMLDIFPLFARFELDDFKFVSREYRRLIDRTVPLFSFRLFYNVDIREGEIDFSIELPYVSRSRLESPHPEVETDLSSKHRIETDPEVALQHLSRAFVQRFAITGTPNRDMMRVLQSRELTFRAATFVIDGADLHGMEVDELRAFIRCVPGMQEFVICDSHLQTDHFSDSLLRDCASRHVEGIRNYQDRENFPMLTGPGIREFYSIAARGRNEPCRMDLRCGGDYTETFLLDFLEVRVTDL
ncbi:hypothetical protein AAVH_31136 [Aphelenchoides avenae]|nr:hypothetical protein AAVH_31136 [Aphelenchus avenae]